MLIRSNAMTIGLSIFCYFFFSFLFYAFSFSTKFTLESPNEKLDKWRTIDIKFIVLYLNDQNDLSNFELSIIRVPIILIFDFMHIQMKCNHFLKIIANKSKLFIFFFSFFNLLPSLLNRSGCYLILLLVVVVLFFLSKKRRRDL